MATHTLRWFDPVDTPEHRADMAVLSVDWTWLDYLSTGDGVRVMLLLQKLEEGGPDDAMIAAAAMLDRIRKTAESRMASSVALRAWYAEKAAPPEFQSPITDAAIDAAVAEAK